MLQYKNLLFLFSFMKKSKKIFVIGVIGMVLASIVVAPVPYLIGYIVDKIILVDGSFDDLLKIVILLIGLYLIRFIISMIYQYYFAKLQQVVVNEVRISMVEKILDAPLSYINKNEKGYILGRISESGSIGSIFSPVILNNIIGIFDMTMSILIMMRISKKLTMVALIVIPIYFIISKYSTNKVVKSTTSVFENSAIVNGEVYEILNGIEDIKMLSGKILQVKKLSEKLNEMIKSVLKQSFSFIFFIENIILANNIVTTLVLFISGVLILKNELTIGIYTSFSIYVSKILANTQAFASLELTLKPVCISIERVKEFFGLENEDSKEYDVLDESIESIELQDIGFRYKDNSELVFDNINYKFENGDKVFINGINGSGKTTLIKLISGLYNPTMGKILINGKDSCNINKTSIREKIGVVSQNIFLFKGSILDNILYGHNNKEREDVIELINKYNLDIFVNRFNNGLDTEIVQSGAGISGGQAQLIAFLRAIIKRKDILILDESTSNLDIETRKSIIDIIKENDLCNILIIISHQDEGLDFIDKSISLS